MVEYVKSLINKHDTIFSGKTYKVYDYDRDGDVRINDGYNRILLLRKTEFSKETETSNPFVREETVVKKTIVSKHHRLSNGLDLSINIRDDYGVTIALEKGQYSKSEVAELARILKEISEAMEH